MWSTFNFVSISLVSVFMLFFVISDALLYIYMCNVVCCQIFVVCETCRIYVGCFVRAYILFELCILLNSFMIFFLEIVPVFLEFDVFDYICNIIFESLQILTYWRAFFILG